MPINVQMSGRGAMRAIAVAAQAMTENTVRVTAVVMRPANIRLSTGRLLGSQTAAAAATSPALQPTIRRLCNKWPP